MQDVVSLLFVSLILLFFFQGQLTNSMELKIVKLAGVHTEDYIHVHIHVHIEPCLIVCCPIIHKLCEINC